MSEIERDRVLDAELRARLAGAPREADPARDLWPEIARALDTRAAGVAVAGRRNGGSRWLGWPLRAAAAIALFAGGVAVGQRWGAASAPPPPREAPVVRAGAPLAAAAEVQRAGSAWVGALSRLDESVGPLEREQGVDAALSAFQGAAYELARLRPDDPQAGRILVTVSEARGEGGDDPTVRF